MNKLKLIFFSLLVVSGSFAQDLSKLTPEQLEMYKKYMTGQNGTAASEQTQRQIPTNDVDKRRVEEKDSLKIYKKEDEFEDKKNKKDQKDQIEEEKNKLKVFGSYLFNTKNLTFEPQLNIPTPVNYVIGAFDELIVDISGYYDANHKLKVSPDGLIRVPNVGPVKVAGLTVEAASRLIKNQVSKVYMGVSSGETKVNVTLGNIRSIRVAVIGEAVRPGNYTLPSLATAFNALYACGGPNDIGSMREVRVIRNGKVIAKLDIYRFLVDGILADNVILHDGDVIKIDPYKIRTALNGAVKHVGLFEALPGESLGKLISYAGGYADNAYKDKITTFRLEGKGKKIVDVFENEVSGFMLKSGDSIVVGTTLDKFDNRVDLLGAVNHPGAYELEPGLTVRQLIEKAGGVKDEAYLNMASLNRKRKNQIPEVIGFNLSKVIDGSHPDILLQKDDSIVVNSLSEYRENEVVAILGAVKKPGIYKLDEALTVRDLIFKAKGFTEMARTDSVELIRPVKDQDCLLSNNVKSLVFKMSLDKELNLKNGEGDIPLQSGDQVIVRSISGFEGVRMVRVEGEVYHPGSYNIISKAERISDVLKRAGGFTKYAYPTGAFLIRSESTNEIEQKLNNIMQENSKNQLQTSPNKSLDANILKASGGTNVQGFNEMDSIQKKLSGSQVIEKIFAKEGVVGLNLQEILVHPGSKYDLKLEEGDIIYVPRELQTVRVLGQVLFPTIVRYDKRMSLRDYVNNSGGFALNANKSKVFVLYPNGMAKSTNSFLGFRTYPKVEPGSRIVVPETPVEIKNKMTSAETVAILTSISSVVALVYSILKQ